MFTAGGQVTMSPTGELWTEARLWFSFIGQAPNPSAPAGAVTIYCDEINQDFVFSLSGNSITRQTAATMLVLDSVTQGRWVAQP